MDWTLLLATVLLVALVASYLRSRDRRITTLVDKLPGPTKLPLVGTLHLMFFVKRKDRYRFFREIMLQYWPIFRTWLGPIPEVHISKAEDLERIMSSNDQIEKAESYTFLYPWLGDGLLTSKGAKWHSHRKIITPTFHFKILDNFVEVFGEKGQILVEKLKSEANGATVDIYPYITRCALDIICETAMGTNIRAQEDINSDYVTAVYDIAKLTMQRVFRPWLHNDFIFRLTKAGKDYHKCLDILHGFTKKVIKERKGQRLQNKGPVTSQVDDLGRKKRAAFLDLLLDLTEADQKMNDKELQEEVDTFMFEGHDTTTVAMSWALILLGHHPDIQERVFEELDSIFEGSDRPPTMQDLQSMKYLEMVIKEALRLYPSVPVIGRKLSKDIELGGYTIPAGVTVMMHISDCHRDPEVWPDPECFDPDNFLPERAQGRHPFAYVPFSGGPRNCIGQKFALLEEKAILSYLIRNYKFESAERIEDLDLIGELVLRPLSGVKTRLTPRSASGH